MRDLIYFLPNLAIAHREEKMLNFRFQNKTEIIFGRGTEKYVGIEVQPNTQKKH